MLREKCRGPGSNGFNDPVAYCRPFCHGSRLRSTSTRRSVPAVAARCTGSERMSPSGSASCRQSSGCWSVRRPKYACRACEDVVVQAPARARLIEGGLPTEATVAQVLVSKYADHLPLYRQAQIYARQGVKLDRSTRPIGSDAVLSCYGRYTNGCSIGCGHPRTCLPTRRPRRFSIPAAAGPKPASCLRMRATTGRGAAPTANRRLRLCPRSQGGAAEDRFCARPRRRKASRPPLWPRSGPWRQDG
jgi:transposase